MNLVVVGKNSRVWQQLSVRFVEAKAIGHSEVGSYSFEADDLVLVLSYSKDREDNLRLLDSINRSGALQVIYIGTASSNVCEITKMYRYPRVKLEAQKYAESLGYQVVPIGLAVNSINELPSGMNAYTTIDDLGDFLERSLMQFPNTSCLVKMFEKPFSSSFEKSVFGIYKKLVSHSDFIRFVLRPFDFVLGRLNWRWYGYYRLSSDLWNTI